MADDPCALCKAPMTTATANPVEGAAYTFCCLRCGTYGITKAFRNTPPVISANTLPYLSAATRQASERGAPLILGQGDVRKFAESHKSSTVSSKIEKLLQAIARRCKQPGSGCNFNIKLDCPLFDCSSSDELLALNDYVVGMKWAWITPGNGGIYAYVLTIEGWLKVQPLSRPGGISGRCFVMMSFDPSLDAAYWNGIKPAIIDCGFTPICMKEIQETEGITDRILAEIRLAEFVVADFTLQRHGVYFEAGFAKALGRTVVKSCREDDLENLHFDTKHYGHVVWTTPEDLRAGLAQSIRANVLRPT